MRMTKYCFTLRLLSLPSGISSCVWSFLTSAAKFDCHFIMFYYVVRGYRSRIRQLSGSSSVFSSSLVSPGSSAGNSAVDKLVVFSRRQPSISELERGDGSFHPVSELPAWSSLSTMPHLLSVKTPQVVHSGHSAASSVENDATYRNETCLFCVLL